MSMESHFTGSIQNSLREMRTVLLGTTEGCSQKAVAGGPCPLLAPCVPCSCNNHSDVCDPETGQCLNCRDHTAGDHCEMCTPGHYGKVIGLPGDCTPCSCPRRPPFSPTCVLEGDGGFRCNACIPGYEGQAAAVHLECPRRRRCAPRVSSQAPLCT
ncbi:hypothetical protein ACRRTK_024753 [Alexandromys fortis]